MFTGIIEELGKVRSFRKSGNACSIKVFAPIISKNIKIGDSIAVNGVCLTVIKQHKDGLEADIMPETLKQTNLGTMKQGEMVNLERAVRPSDRLGGHIVSGHIDGAGKIISSNRDRNAIILKIKTESQIMEFVVPKGSVAIDGVSLTVTSVLKNSFYVSIVPHTAETTTLGFKKRGESVNLETDIMAKHIKKFFNKQKENIDTEMLKKFGYLKGRY
ncbi:riboflavin synthase [Candidatus Oleimmundimicrobium sp.]|uniref:riboflavin synthase n=1 Tax=Candidatus Oleimmundimicrobium sp. TaxID=3060597 RepID=UPI0027158FDF|nr:riboflavin synthase [Candidatus Oleimmundimicrobium sp.]MDO8885385.1 riboflavin synthase [Candidatus Oleimmundimicrobium sp.]